MPQVNEQPDPISAHVWRVSAVVILGSIMSILDTTIVNVALATLRRELHATISQIQWVVTGYMLALAAVIPVTGWAARRFGAKRVYLVSLVLFTAGSALCGLAADTTELIVFRVLQGVGGGMILPIGQLMMAEAAGPKRMGRVMSIVAVPAMLAPILGPTIGGLIVQNASWRWIFYVNVPIGVIAVIAAIRVLPTVKPGPTDRLDVRGLLLMATGLPLLTYGLAEIGVTGSFTSAKVIVPCLARARAGRGVRAPRAAGPQAAARHAPVPAADVLLGLVRDVLPRRGAVRRDDPAAAVLAGRPPRERRRHRPADRAPGPRRRARHADRRQAHRPLSAAGRSRCSA